MGGAALACRGVYQEKCRVLRLVETGPTVAGAGHGVEMPSQRTYDN